MKILKPQIPNQHSPYWHPGDSFRELLDMWGENKFCEVIPTNTNLIWVEREGGILLYDRDQLNQLPPALNLAYSQQLYLHSLKVLRGFYGGVVHVC